MKKGIKLSVVGLTAVAGLLISGAMIWHDNKKK